MKEKLEGYAIGVVRVLAFILGAIFVVSIVAIVARFAWLLMFAKACIEAG